MIKKTLRQTLKILLILFIAAAVVCGLWFVKKDSVAGVRYYHFDTAAFDDKCEQLSDASKAKDADEMIRLYDELYSDCEEFETLYEAAYILYTMDMDNDYYADEQSWSINALEKCADKLCGICHDIALSSNAEAFRKHVGDGVFEKFREYRPYSDRELEIMEEEQSLVDDYYDLYTDPDLAIEYDGVMWDIDKLDGPDGDELYDFDPKEYYRVAEQVEKKFNEKAGPIYKKMVVLRNEFANLRGYEDYVAYADEVEYTRDYTDEETRQLHEDVKAVMKEYLPLYRNYYRNGYEYLPYMTNGQLLDTLCKYSEETCDTAGQAAKVLKEKNLYSIESGANRQPGGYTMELDKTDLPFIFITNSEGENVLPTLTHEFGHFTEFLNDEGDNILMDSDCIDLAEIASNGFEGLMTNYYDEIFPDQADSARHEIIDELMENILYGCMQDEFQREVYRDPDMTLQEMNRLCARIYRDYGIDSAPEAYSWVFVTHMFEVPMYNISYAVSGLAAMQIWSRSETDFDGAVSIWEKFLDEGIYNRSYLEVVERCGLEKFTEPGAVEAICKPALDAFR